MFHATLKCFTCKDYLRKPFRVISNHALQVLWSWSERLRVLFLHLSSNLFVAFCPDSVKDFFQNEEELGFLAIYVEQYWPEAVMKI